MYMKKNAQPFMSRLAEVKQRSEDAHDKVDIYMYVGYGVSSISRLLKTIGLFCKRAL